MFNIEKLIQACGYILKKYDRKLNYTKLIKLLYIADKEALKESFVTISGDEYVCMPNGPVLSKLYDLVRNRYGNKDIQSQSLWNARFATDGYDIIALLSDYPEGKLSDYEKKVLDHVDFLYHGKTFGEMIDLVHDKNVCPEWSDPGDTSRPLPLAEILKSVGYSDIEIEWAIKETQTFDKEDQLLSELALV